MADMLFCRNCRTPIRDVSPGGDPAQPRPCPQCGSILARQDGEVSEGVSPGGREATHVSAYPDALLATARRMIAEEEFGVAVVVAHMACEITLDSSENPPR